MFLVLLLLTLLHAVDCPGWQPGTGTITHAVWTERPRAPASCRTHPVTAAVATEAVPAPATPPPGQAPGTGPPSRLEGVCTPTAHEGAPARDDGPGSSLGVESSPGSGEGPRAAVGVWRYSGALRLSLSPGVAGAAAGGLPPPPPAPPPRGQTEPAGLPGSEHRVPGGRRQQGACRLLTPGGPCPNLLTSEPTTDAGLTGTTCRQGVARPPPLARACERALAGGGGGGQRSTPPRFPAGHPQRGWWWARQRYEPRRPPPWCGPGVRTPDLAGGCLYAHSPQGRPRARRRHWVPPRGGGWPGLWHGAPRHSGGLAV